MAAVSGINDDTQAAEAAQPKRGNADAQAQAAADSPLEPERILSLLSSP
jgi:hypothetical protein